MTLTRRLAAGLPVVGVAALAALAFAGTPADATETSAGRPAVTSSPDGYGNGDAVPGASAAPDDGRGHAGYGSQSPTPSSTPSTPTATTNTVPPGGVSPTTSPPPKGYTNTVPPGGVSPTTVGPSGGVSAGTLALTGTPVTTTITTGAVLLAGGGAAIWYTRRRRTA